MNFKNKKLILLGVVLMGLAAAGLSSVNAVPRYDSGVQLVDPWGKKPVLPYFFFTAEPSFEEKKENLFKVLALSEKEKGDFQKIIEEEQAEISQLEEDGQVVIRYDKKEKINASQFNSRLQNILKDTDQEIRKLLGSRYPVFRKAIRDLWRGEQERVKQFNQPEREIGILSDVYYCNVYATQYMPDPVKGNTSYEVALPDKYLKFANRGWPHPINYNWPPYTVNIKRSYYSVWNVKVNEVGPWNEDDNYWDAGFNSMNPRRLFSDLPACQSEAYSAYFFGYNNGKDQWNNRTITNPASVDLTPAVASHLGLGYRQNSWVWVYYSDLP